MQNFNREIGRHRYRDSPYLFYVQAYRDGWSIGIDDEVTGESWKFSCSRMEEIERSASTGDERTIVTWRVGAPGGVKLPGTDKYIRDLVRDFLGEWDSRSASPEARMTILF
jgi:hypothetical protein